MWRLRKAGPRLATLDIFRWQPFCQQPTHVQVSRCLYTVTPACRGA
jgi:hypothetical protein